MRRSVALAAAAALVAVVAGAVAWGTASGPDQVVDATAAPPVAPSGPIERAVLDPAPDLAWGPSALEYATALAEARALPLDVAAGHVIVASVSSPDAAAAAALVRDLHLGGVIVMGDAVVDADQVRALTAAVAEAGAADGRGWPAIVSTDQEGGPVARLDGLVPDLPAFMAAGSAADKASVTAVYAASARDLGALGFTVNWAPVADVTVGPSDPVIGVRAASSDPVRVAATVDAAVEGYLSGGVMPSIKHFPGHGSVTTDSHAALPTQTGSVAQLEASDFVPFASAIKAGAPMVMMGHIAVAEWGEAPATLNPAAYAYLRTTMGFSGVTVTDALNMAAVAMPAGGADPAVAALAAGADLLLMPTDPSAARAAVIAAVESGAVPRQRLDEAVARVALLMGEQADLATAARTSPMPDAGYARSFAASSATVSAPACGGPLVGPVVTITGGWPSERQALADALAGYGITTGEGTRVQLLGTPTGTGAADVVVALDGPWGLAGSSASVYVGLYGRSDDALAGLADVLAGAVVPQGQWAVPGLPAACSAP